MANPQILAEVREGFVARGILFDAALVGLERAYLQLRIGDTASVKEDAPELAEIFRRLRVGPELLTSLGLFCTAALVESATADQAFQILRQLRPAESGGALAG